MIIHLKQNVSSEQAEQLAIQTESVILQDGAQTILITPSALKTLPVAAEALTDSFIAMESDMQLSSKKYKQETRQILLKDKSIGGQSNNTVVIAGPCSVESEEQITQTAEMLKQHGISVLRAGSFKPRTSPYSFQGMGIDGLKLLAKIRDQYGLLIATEVRDATHVDAVIDYADIIQIGAKSMYDHGILRKCAKANKPILLKRGFGTTLQELVQAAEFLLSGGNAQVALCERGIRTFETKTRFTLDLCGVAYLKEYTNLPVILDPSHAMGYAYGIADLSRACMAMGVDGLLIEVHPNPKEAKSDAAQQLNHQQFADLFQTLKPIAHAIGKTII